MKKILFFICFICFYVYSFSSDKKRDEVIVTPDVSLIDIPTAGVIDYANFNLKTRFYNNGGVLTYINAGILQNITLGASFMIDNLIGSNSPVKMVRPEMQLKFRFYDGGYYIPALALGYDGQGYYYDRSIKKYMQKGKGLYLVGSKELFFPGFMTSAGFNIPDYDEGYLYSFVGFNYNMDDKLNLMLEFDNMFHSDYPSRINAGVRININSNFFVDVAFRNIGKNEKFPNGWDNKIERIVQFNTSFYLGNF